MKEEELAKEFYMARLDASGPNSLFGRLAHYLAPLITAQEEKDEPPYPAKQIIDLLKLEGEQLATERDEALARVKELEQRALQWEERARELAGGPCLISGVSMQASAEANLARALIAEARISELSDELREWKAKWEHVCKEREAFRQLYVAYQQGGKDIVLSVAAIREALGVK